MAFNNKMHERNIYKNRPDFSQMAKDFPLFRKYVIPNDKGKIYFDFSDTEALRMLTTILLKKDFELDVEIPPGYLIPTIPQRLNYILWVEDLLANISQAHENVSGIDIGTGPCAIFSLLGAKRNGWSFTSTESSPDAYKWANKNIRKNNLVSKINVLKVSQNSTLNEVLSVDEKCYDFCLCNPPFYETTEEIRRKHPNSEETIADVAQNDEIFFKGGEVEFVRSIIKDSLAFKKRIRLFSSMFGKKSSFEQIHKELLQIQDLKIAVTEFCQGNTVRWGIAWSFDDSVQFPEVKKKEKPKKPKPPLEFQIRTSNDKTFMMDALSTKVQNILNEFKISVTPVRGTKTYTELLLKSDKCTWTHQRRKRRELLRQKENSCRTQLSNGVSDNPVDETSSKNINCEKDTCAKNIDQSYVASITESKVTDNLGIPFSKQDSMTNTTLGSCNKSESTNVRDIQEIGVSMLPDNSIEQNQEENSQLSGCSLSSYSNTLHKKRKHDSDQEESTELKKIKRDENERVVQGTVLNCKLQLIKGRKNVYVKMNCSQDADRNVMYQVFQMIKNKLE